MEEIWKDIEGYEGLYQVSNLGKVRSLNYNRTGKTRLLRPNPNENRYLKVSLCKNGKAKTYKVHRLVAQAFIPNPDGFPEINHIDEDQQNNRVDNLEWCDHIYNSNHGTRNKRISSTKLNDQQKSKRVRCVETGEVYPSQSEAARQTGMNRSNIAQVCRGERKTVGGFHWEFAETD